TTNWSNSCRVSRPTKAATRTAPARPTTRKARVSLRDSERISGRNRIGRQTIADTIDCHDVAWIARVGFDLRTQIADVNIDRPLISLVGVALQLVEQFKPREHASGRGQKCGQQ